MICSQNLQSSLLTLPVAISADRATRVLRKRIILMESFKSLMPCLGIVTPEMVLSYQSPDIAPRIRDYLFGECMRR